MDKSRNKRVYLHIILQAAVFVILIIIDRITKNAAFNHLKDGQGSVFIKDVFSFHYVENTGAAFGIFSDSKWFFIILSSVILVVIIITDAAILAALKRYCANNGFNEKTYKSRIFLGYLLCVLGAGAAGNLYDRISYGYVIDFISADFVSFPVFNAADIYVTVSVIMLMIFFIFFYREDKDFRIFRNVKRLD